MSLRRSTILHLLKEHSVKIAESGKEFTLASGAKSRFYIDVKKTAMSAEAHFPLASLLYDKLAQGDFGAVEAVAGVALGGCHLASIVGLYARTDGQTKLNVVYVRKEAKDHGTKNLVEGPVMAPGSRVVLLEDVVTTGGSSIKAVNQLKDAGFLVTGILAVIDRRAKADRTTHLNGQPFESLYTLDDFEEAPSDPV